MADSPRIQAVTPDQLVGLRVMFQFDFSGPQAGVTWQGVGLQLDNLGGKPKEVPVSPEEAFKYVIDFTGQMALNCVTQNMMNQAQQQQQGEMKRILKS